MTRPTKVVSVRVRENLPAEVRAATGMSFSKAITQFFEPFIEHMKKQTEDKSNG